MLGHFKTYECVLKYSHQLSVFHAISSIVVCVKLVILQLYLVEFGITYNYLLQSEFVAAFLLCSQSPSGSSLEMILSNINSFVY